MIGVLIYMLSTHSMKNNQKRTNSKNKELVAKRVIE